MDAPQDQVFEVLVDTRTYPEWWTPTYVEGESDGPPEPGSVSRVKFKGKLPITLTATSRLVAVNRPHEFDTEVEGDLRGVAIWTLTPAGGDLPHTNLMPYTTLRYIIALQGNFPPRP